MYYILQAFLRVIVLFFYPSPPLRSPLRDPSRYISCPVLFHVWKVTMNPFFRVKKKGRIASFYDTSNKYLGVACKISIFNEKKWCEREENPERADAKIWMVFTVPSYGVLPKIGLFGTVTPALPSQTVFHIKLYFGWPFSWKPLLMEQTRLPRKTS